MKDILLPYHLLVPTLLGLLIAYVIFRRRKRIMKLKYRRIVWMSGVLLFTCYALFVGAAATDDIICQFKYASFDLNGDKVVAGNELTSEYMEVRNRLTHDIGRNLSIITGLIFSSVISATFLVGGLIIERVLIWKQPTHNNSR